MSITLTSIQAICHTLRPLRATSKIALVPTMGNLHDGHLELVKLAKTYADIVIVSIFVNPTQFGAGEDLDSYPRTLEEDTKKLNKIGVDYIFAPTVSDMYPVLPPPTQVLAGIISQSLCGRTRPTHFDGVGLVVSKLFNIVQPDIAVFGKKDYQQLAIVKQLVRDLSYDIDIISAPIIRDEDGLALSSRNQYLTQTERQIAPKLQYEINSLADKLAQKKHIIDNEPDNLALLYELINETINHIGSYGFKVDYLEVINQDLTDVIDTVQSKSLVIVAAAWLGKARLLDNKEVNI